MSQPIAVDILSDDDDGDGVGGFHHRSQIDAISTPSPALPKKQKTDSNNSNPTTVFLIDDDPTPVKPRPQLQSEPTASTPSFVPETPMSELSKSEVSIVKCTAKGWGSTSEPNLRACTFTDPSTSGINGLIFLESDKESEHNSECKAMEQNETTAFALESTYLLDERYISGNEDITQMSRESFSQPIRSEDDNPQVTYQFGEEVDRLESLDDVSRVKDISKGRNKGNTNKKRNIDGATGKKRITEEERVRLMEEKKQKKELEKLQKASQKAEAAKMKKMEKEKQKWQKGKFALKSIVAEIDTKVVELGSVGGHLLTRFAEKGLTYRIASNTIERSIVWTWDIPDQLSELSHGETGIPYVLLVFEAEEFCNLVMGEALMSHVSRVQSHYPSHTICYLTNRLMAYINKREQGRYKNPANYSGWKRPPVEEVLSKLTTNFFKVHSRQCVDEAELAEHVVGLTCSLASCQFRKKLTRLSVNANGSLIPKDCVDKNQVKKSLWLKALIAIPKVQPRFAIAIWKKYPTMKSLLSVYMDPNKPVHEKEFLLKDLMTEGLLGDDRRLGEMCSKRVYRILMAQSGNIGTDDVEEGADFFSHLSP